MSIYPCQLIEDLIPLYIEDALSEESRSIVEQHINECTDCHKLLHEYKVQEVLPPDMPESLPKVDTFKSTVKRMRKWGLYLLLVLVIATVAVAGISYHLGSNSLQDLLSVKQVVSSFAKEGLELRQDNGGLYAGEEINGVVPACYKIAGCEDQVLIYAYEDFDSRKDAARKWEEKEAADGVGGFISFDEPTLYGAKNILIIYIAGNKEPGLEDVERAGKIRQLVFYKLNNAQKIVFTGEGQYWQAQYTVDYYDNWMRSQEGRLEYDQYHFSKPALTYKNGDLPTGTEVNYNFESPEGRSSGNFEWPGNNSRVLGTGGGNGAFPRETATINVTVKWNGQEETFELKASDSK